MTRLLFCGALLASFALQAGPPDTVFLEELTWTEVRDALKAGRTTVLLPTGGTEQNGPHLALGKHNYIVRHASEQIARRLGNALVAPVLAYVPEGDLEPPTGHMLFPGTITLPDEHFRKVVEYAARSFRVNGFRDIVFLGDSGANQAGLKAVADALNREWAASGVRVHYSPGFYAAGYAPGGSFSKWLQARGETPDSIGRHAGVSDTSQLLAIAPEHVRLEKLVRGHGRAATGVDGDPARASAAYGRKGIEMRVETAVEEIRASMTRRR